MCRSMVNIQSATDEIRRGKKKEERRKKKQDKNIMFASAMQGGHNHLKSKSSPASLQSQYVLLCPGKHVHTVLNHKCVKVTYMPLLFVFPV